MAARWFSDAGALLSSMKHFGEGVYRQGVEVAAAQYVVLPRPFDARPMVLSPFEVDEEEMLVSCSSNGPLIEEAFHDFERLWADKWHGKEGSPENTELTASDAQRSVIEILRSTLSSLGCRLRRSSSSLRGSEFSWEWVEEPRGLFSAHSWKRMFSNKPIGPKLTKSGPCELFADWPIPPYPSDYNWDD